MCSNTSSPNISFLFVLAWKVSFVRCRFAQIKIILLIIILWSNAEFFKRFFGHYHVTITTESAHKSEFRFFVVMLCFGAWLKMSRVKCVTLFPSFSDNGTSEKAKEKLRHTELDKSRPRNRIRHPRHLEFIRIRFPKKL